LGILDELDEAALIEILTKPRNAILKQYAKLFDYEGVKITFSDDAAKEIAREALQRKVGARGLRMILEELMLDLMYYVPGNKKVTDLTITADMVKKHSLTLPMLLEKAQTNNFAAKILRIRAECGGFPRAKPRTCSSIFVVTQKYRMRLAQ
jgi:ATP-dependent Clp protease ATP-binding subunit ClpX